MQSIWDTILKTDEVYNAGGRDTRSNRTVLKWLADPKNRRPFPSKQDGSGDGTKVVPRSKRGSYK